MASEHARRNAEDAGPSDPLAGRVLGDYEVERRLSSGGFGSVYAARHVRTGRAYALKVLRPDRAIVSPDARERFRREADALSALGHVGIVAIHDYAQDEGFDYIVMDLLDGEDLASRLSRGALAVDDALEMIDLIADALDTAHRAEIIHRDLKPANVFLATTPGEGERPVLLDFGLAKDVSGSGAASLTASGDALGTPAYMAPEQASGGGIDARTDVYALAALSYEMLTGRPPFEGANAASVLLRAMTEAPEPVSGQVEVPEHVSIAVHRGLEKEPNDRFPSVLAFRDALRGRSAPEVPQTRTLARVTGPETRASQRPAVAARSTLHSVARGAPLGLALLVLGGVGLWWFVDSSQDSPPEPVNAVPANPVETATDPVVTEAVIAPDPEIEPESDQTSDIVAEADDTPAPAQMSARVGAPPQRPPTRAEMVRVAPPSERATAPSDTELDGARRTELGQLEALLVRVEQTRTALETLGRGREPALCRRRGGRPSGGSPTVVRSAQRLDGLIERACAPFAAAREPSDEVRSSLRQMPSVLDRAETMAQDTSSTNEPRAIAEQVEAAIGRAREAFEGVQEGRRAFPCDHPVWSELRRLATSENSWAGAAATRVTRQQGQICSRLGLGRDRLSGVARTAEDQLDDLEGQVRSAIRPLRSALGATP